MDIQKFRYEGFLTMRVWTDPAILKCRVPRLSLQPLIENTLSWDQESERRHGTILDSGISGEGRIHGVLRGGGYKHWSNRGAYETESGLIRKNGCAGVDAFGDTEYNETTGADVLWRGNMDCIIN